jgi:hypothetical protein
MWGHSSRSVRIALGALLLTGVALVLGATSARSDVPGTYTVHNLSSNVPGLAAHTDPDLQNGWGITEPTTGPWWVADNGTDKSTLYTAGGTKLGLVVEIANGAPTGTVFNGGSGFTVSAGTKSGPALFIFASESGTISGWNPAVDATHSVVGVAKPGAVYKGLALATAASGPQLYATDFVGGHVDVFSSTFGPGVATGGFVDPKLPSGYAPFGIATVNGMLVVHSRSNRPVARTSFTTRLRRRRRVRHRRQPDLADRDTRPAQRAVGHCPGARKVRSIQRRPADRELRRWADQRLRTAARRIVGASRRAPGLIRSEDLDRRLVGIGFGNNGAAGPSTTLYFAAGPNDEADGLFGSITAN